MCACFVTSVRAYLRVGGEQSSVCASLISMCVLSEKWVFCIVGDDRGFLVLLLLVSVWFQLSTKLCVFSQQVQRKLAGTTR